VFASESDGALDHLIPNLGISNVAKDDPVMHITRVRLQGIVVNVVGDDRPPPGPLKSQAQTTRPGKQIYVTARFS
jgi:hypothetical protein